MSIHTHQPRLPLAEFVDVMWYCVDYRPPHAAERILPDGRMALIINLREDRLRLYDSTHPNRFQTVGGAVVSGAQPGFHVVDTECQNCVIGVHFKPGGAFPFFGLPADELGGSHVPLAELWGAQSADLRGQLLEAVTPADKFKVFSRALVARLRAPASGHPAVQFALREFARVPVSRGVAAVAEQTGFSHRRFVQLFREEVGLTPKLFCRIRRFHEVIRVASEAREVDWADLALSCGYFDQAHFNHDFRTFSGLNPTSYLQHRGEHLNHVPLGD